MTNSRNKSNNKKVMMSRRNGGRSISRKALKAALNSLAELKAATVLATSQTVTTAGVIIPISQAIVEGPDANQRDGAQIRLKHIRAEFRATAITNAQTVRFILFRDLQNIGSNPAVTDLLGAAFWLSPYATTTELQQKRFSIIRDWTVDVNITSNVVQSLVFNKRAIGNINYNTSTNVTAANGKGAVYLLVIGSNSTGGYDYAVQLDYTDY